METVDLIDNLNLELQMPIDGLFVLGVSELDVDRLSATESDGDADAGYVWVEVLCESSEINIRRGLNLNQNVFARAEASELVAVVHGPDIDPLENQKIGPNTKVRVRVFDNPTWETLFTGRVRQMLSTYSKDKEAVVTITAFDLIDSLNNILAIDATDDESFADRMTGLATSGGTTISTTGGTVTLAPVETYRSVWDQMNIAANSEGGIVYSNRQGTLEARGRGATAGTAVIEFDDIHNADPLHSCYSEIDVSYDSTNVTNSLTITNISTVDAEGNDIEEAIGIYTDTNSIQAYGENNLSVLTNLPDLTDIEDLRDYVFDYYTAPFKRVNSITFDPSTFTHTLIDVGDYVSVIFHGSNNNVVVDDLFMVTSVTHSIVPQGWTITLELFKDWSLTGGGGYEAPGWSVT